MTRTGEVHERLKAALEIVAAIGRRIVSTPASGCTSSATMRPPGCARFTRGWRS